MLVLPRSSVCVGAVGALRGVLLGGLVGKVQLRQDKPQLPKGEPQAQAPGTHQAPTRPRRRRGHALSDGAASHARLQTSGTHTAKRSKANCKIPQQCFTQTLSG